MGKVSRDKGARGERLWRDECIKQGFEAKRGCQLFQKGSEIADVVGLPGIHIECKFVEKLNLRAAMEQSERDAGQASIPIVAHKTSRKEWLVTLRADDWFKMYKAYLSAVEIRH
jgi:Holliday junction resolvase